MPLQFTPTPNAFNKRPAPLEATHPRAKRRRGLNLLSDAKVWGCSDREILVLLNAASSAWRSSVYDHYEPSLERHYNEDGEPEKLIIRFNRKFHEHSHGPLNRDHMWNCDGTRNLLVAARSCDSRRGVEVLANDGPEGPTP